MGKLVEKLNKNKLTLVVSLPENSLEMAVAAEEAGADALKVHINVHHDASGTHFGSFEGEKKNLESIVKGVTIPVGIVPGADVSASENEIELLRNMGFDFIDMYLAHIPAWMFGVEDISKMVALSEKYSVDKIISLDRMGADIVEAAVVPHNRYGEKMSIGDLQDYITIAVASPLPVIIPTQRKIDPDEVSIIADTGVKGLMIGAIVTGKTVDSIRQATKNFRKEIDNLTDNE